MKIFRIAVVGAECTGKSQLCEQLAACVPGITFEEPLRRWVRELGVAPSAHEQEQLVQWQQQAEANACKQARDQGWRAVLCDSAPLVTAVYSDLYYQDRSLYALAYQHHLSYDLTLWCQPDIPWQADPGMRDGETYRQQTHQLLSKALAQHQLHRSEKTGSEAASTEVIAVIGMGQDRWQTAWQAIQHRLLQGLHVG